MPQILLKWFHPYLGPNAVDISPEKDGGVMKEVTTAAPDGDMPLSGDKVGFLHCYSQSFGSVSFNPYHVARLAILLKI